MEPLDTIITLIAVTIGVIGFIIGSIFDVDNRGGYTKIWIGIGLVVLMGIIGIIVVFAYFVVTSN